MVAKASIDLTATVSPPNKVDLTGPPPKIDLTTNSREELLGLLRCQSDRFSAETSRCCGSGAGEIPQYPSHSTKAEKIVNIVQELLLGEKQLLNKK